MKLHLHVYRKITGHF